MSQFNTLWYKGTIFKKVLQLMRNIKKPDQTKSNNDADKTKNDSNTFRKTTAKTRWWWRYLRKMHHLIIFEGEIWWIKRTISFNYSWNLCLIPNIYQVLLIQIKNNFNNTSRRERVNTDHLSNNKIYKAEQLWNPDQSFDILDWFHPCIHSFGGHKNIVLLTSCLHFYSYQ